MCFVTKTCKICDKNEGLGGAVQKCSSVFLCNLSIALNRQQIKAGCVVYHDDDDIPEEVARRISALSSDERAELLQQIISELVNEAVKRKIAENFKRVQADVKGIIARECWQSQEIHQPESAEVDPRMVDPLCDF